MIIGVPKEIKNHEYRVGLTPRSVKEFINHGHKVLVQTNAGVGLGSYFGWNVKRNSINSLLAGTFSGIFGMIAAIGGPPVAILYRGTKGSEFRPSLNAVFTLGILITLSLLVFTGNLLQDHLVLFLYLVLPVLLGIRFSSLLFSRVSDKLIADMVTYFSIFSGAVVIYRALF